MIDDRMPVLIGAGQFTQRTARENRIAEGLDPVGLLETAARRAAEDAGNADAILHSLEAVSAVRFTADSTDGSRLGGSGYTNVPKSLAMRLNAHPHTLNYTATGGNTPQWLVNRTAEEIAEGKYELALLAGGEYLATLLGAMKRGIALKWGEDTGDHPTHIGDDRAPVTKSERDHGLYFPVNTYPLFENGLRAAKKRSVKDHMAEVGRMFARFSEVAAENPYAWFPVARTAEEIVTPSEQNRYVGFPYTKYLNAVIEVDQSAAIIMASVRRARELGIPEEKWVYLHGCADANDLWHVTERVNFHSSPAIKMMGTKALAMAGKSVSDISFFDLYSCFPSIVQIACDELGISANDPRPLTVTGGLPYFGGPGNNYTMHGIATMMGRVRQKPGSFGLVTGNGWYVTKHSMGIYSTTPVNGKWQREAPKSYQHELNAMTHPRVVEEANGPATVETYTMVTDRQGRRFGIVIGRLGDGSRFVSNTASDEAIIQRLLTEEMLGRPGHVKHEGGKNIFTIG